MKILIVDDNAANLKLLRVNLEAEGHSSLEAADGVAALQTLEREPVDAVVSDVLMPRMDGYRLCHELRQSKKFRHLPFIVYSSTYTSPADEKLARDFGADEFIKKPSSIRVILDAVKRLTATARERTEGSAGAVAEFLVMKEYSELLVGKLEQKNVELEQTREQLIGTNQELLASTEELHRAKEELRKANEDLEVRVRLRTAELESANKELEAFSYSISHDLRAPLRAIDGFSNLLLGKFLSQAPVQAQHYLQQISGSAQRMGQLIDDLLEFARFSRQPLNKRTVDVRSLVDQVLKELQHQDPHGRFEIKLGPLPACEADPALLKQVWMNLLSNAFKFTRQCDPAVIEVGCLQRAHEWIYFIHDNGAGFDMQYAGKLFGVFQRLHPNDEFEGTGVGLSIVQRIIHRHGGRIWTEAEVGQGAAFFFTTGGVALNFEP
jgi:signal transduction histidine kinase